jgi:hypothetical protein
VALNDEVELGLIAIGVFFLSVYDERGVSLGPVTDGFIKPAQGSSVDDLDTNFLPVFLGQLVDPATEVEIIFFQLLRIFIEVPLISLSLQTHLVCNKLVMLSTGIRHGDERKHFYRNGFHFFA